MSYYHISQNMCYYKNELDGLPPGTVFLRVPTPGPVNIMVNTPENSGNVPCPSQGEVHIHLGEDLYTQWENNGEHGEGFAGDSPGVFRWIAESMRIDEVIIPDTLSHALVVTFDPDSAAVACAFDVIQLDSLDAVVGGERFVYEPPETESFSGSPMERMQQESLLPHSDPRISIFPVPARGLLQVNVEGLDHNLRENLFAHIYDVFGKRWSLQTMPVPEKGRSSARFNVEALPAGLYYLRIALPGLNIQTVRFIKI